MSRIKLFFTTDLHGATIVFKKAIRFAERYKINYVIFGGDITGKALIPVKKLGIDGYHVEIPGILRYSSNDLNELLNKIQPYLDKGFYYALYTEDKCVEEDLDNIILSKMLDRLGEWIMLANTSGVKNNINFYFMGGNDDPIEVVDFLENNQSDHCIHVDSKVIYLEDGVQLLSSGYSNLTPWRLPRDIPDEEFEEILYGLASELDDKSIHIFNIHAPPYGTNLDLAPLLDKDMRPVLRPGGGYELVNVGSKAVRKLIEDIQPILSLHGHIHESRGFHKIGRTLAINPGSEYQEGVLRGAVIIIDKDRGKIEDFILIQA